MWTEAKRKMKALTSQHKPIKTLPSTISTGKTKQMSISKQILPLVE